LKDWFTRKNIKIWRNMILYFAKLSNFMRNLANYNANYG